MDPKLVDGLLGRMDQGDALNPICPSMGQLSWEKEKMLGTKCFKMMEFIKQLKTLWERAKMVLNGLHGRKS